MVAMKDWKADFDGNEQQLLQRRVLFTNAQNPVVSSMQIPHLEPLNDLLPSDRAMHGGVTTPISEECKGSSGRGTQQQLWEDSVREDGVWLAWEGPILIGAGLQNLGNTCFLNSVLQCMTYTPPLAKYLRSGQHKVSCHVTGFCAACALEVHVKQVLSSTNKIISPQLLVKNLRSISRAFQPWRQEDAHEYMRYLVDALHNCLSGSKAKGAPSELNESLVYKIFGGRLRSQVKCTNCLHSSEIVDPFLDLSLEIVNANSLSRALANFTKKEVIDGDNKYHCEKCNHKVRAIKCFTIDSAPNILTLQFKRFSNVGHYGGKIDKKVDFGQTLDITPFLSKGQDACKYKLYAVLVHSGGSTRSGHYYCFVRTSTDIWHILDDSRVKQVSERSVLEQKAYMLFYVRDPTLTRPELALFSKAPRCKIADPETVKVHQLGRVSLHQNLVSVPTNQHAGKLYADSNGVTKVQPLQLKDMQQSIGFTTKSTNFSVDGKRNSDTSKANTSEQNIPTSMVDSTYKDPEILSIHACNIFSQQHKQLDFPETFTSLGVLKGEQAEDSMKASTSMESCIEHLEVCKDFKRAGSKKPQLHHLKFLKMMPRARNVLLAKALSILKRRPKPADPGCYNVPQVNGIAIGRGKIRGSRKNCRKRKRETAAFYLRASQKRLRVNDHGGLANKNSADRVATPKSCEQPILIRKEQFEEPKDIMKKKQVNMILSVAERICNGQKSKVSARCIDEDIPRGKSNLRVPESMDDCARDGGLGSIVKSPRILPSYRTRLYGLEVPSWNGVDDSKQYHQEINNLMNLERNRSQKKIDPWDEDYDRGKIKKVRKGVAADSDSCMQHRDRNPFQTLMH